MNLKAAYQILSILLILLPFAATAQVSKGGAPIQIQKLKSVSVNSDLVVLPAIDNHKMRNMNSRSSQNRLKPFRFAYPFEVSLNLNNSGIWYNTTKVNVWQLRIRSAGAFSLNFIFDRYRLPENARLFIISAVTGEIKGAYTSDNNSASNFFAVEPLEGDELLLQYEEPVDVAFRGELQIAKVAHDYVGIITKDHRPLGISGSCNVNINCDVANGSENVRDGVCRIIINGSEICTGTMVNNTALDGAPYVLTAYHCITSQALAQTSVFLFNYESPYCGSIDGDISHSLSGSSLKASFDSLDFSLIRLNAIPPDNFRPYLVGWNRKNSAPATSVCIHHPLGDVKKIAIDNNAAVSSNFNSSYLANGFWNILKWEYGVTEEGSSGGPLFDQNKQLVGTLTGGAASCPPGLQENDYFEKFALAWDYRKESNKQLKAWLDPINSNVEKLDGLAVNSEETTCSPKTNFKDTDTHANIQIQNGIIKKGYWGGSNSSGYTEFAEQFTFSKSCEVSGVSLGIAKVKTTAQNSTSYISVQVYKGTNKPELLIHTDKFLIKDFYGDAMNYLSFSAPVKTTGNFFVSYDISKLNTGDSLTVYIANRKNDVTNSFFLKNAGGWSAYNSQNISGNGSALLMELVACNIVDTTSVNDSIPKLETNVRFYPNPVSGNSTLTVETADQIDSPDEVEVYDLLGKKQDIEVTQTGTNTVTLSFSGKRSGIYFIRLQAGGKSIKGKVAYLR